MYIIGTMYTIGKPKATLKNNKRSDFKFGVREKNVKFTCEALSYPFPEKIEFKLQAVVLDGNTKGVTQYESDVVSIDVNAHKASFIVNNLTGSCLLSLSFVYIHIELFVCMQICYSLLYLTLCITEVFRNDSVFECRVFRKGDREEAISQERIILVDEAPPIETTTGVNIPDVTQESAQVNGELEVNVGLQHHFNQAVSMDLQIYYIQLKYGEYFITENVIKGSWGAGTGACAGAGTGAGASGKYLLSIFHVIQPFYSSFVQVLC